MTKKLNMLATIQDGLRIALVNFLSLIAATILYILTIWIPYLNVGTTIAMSSLPAELAKGKVINPLFIFEGKYRRNIGEYFILIALMTLGIYVGFTFLIIPGIVISIAWSLAAPLFVDKDKGALEALRESNTLTYGNKWRIFGAEFLLGLVINLIVILVIVLTHMGDVQALEVIGGIIAVIIILFAIPALYGVEASIYKQLTSGEIIDEETPTINVAEES